MSKSESIKTQNGNFLCRHDADDIHQTVYFYADKFKVLRMVDKEEWEWAKTWEGVKIEEGLPMAVLSLPMFDECESCHTAVPYELKWCNENKVMVCKDCYIPSFD